MTPDTRGPLRNPALPATAEGTGGFVPTPSPFKSE